MSRSAKIARLWIMQALNYLQTIKQGSFITNPQNSDKNPAVSDKKAVKTLPTEKLHIVLQS